MEKIQIQTRNGLKLVPFYKIINLKLDFLSGGEGKTTRLAITDSLGLGAKYTITHVASGLSFCQSTENTRDHCIKMATKKISENVSDYKAWKDITDYQVKQKHLCN